MGLILPQKIKIKWTKRNYKYYQEKGYIYTKFKDEFEINVLDLPDNSITRVKCICDYCGKECTQTFSRANPNKKYEYISELKLCCNIKCQNKKTQDILNEKYGVINVSQIKEVKEKIKQTNLKKYGSTSYLQTDDFKIKSRKTCLKKYNVELPSKSHIIRNKINTTCIKKYGSKCSLNDPLIRKNAIIKSKQTMYKNGTCPCSKQQKYLHELLGGELNYPVDNCSLDIAFPSEMIYIEYDGSGHDASVNYGISREQFNRKEFKRTKYLENRGWKIIRILSKKDLIPQNQDIIKLIKEAKYFLLNNNNSWYEIDIDKLEIRCAKYTKNILLNNLRKITNDDFDGLVKHSLEDFSELVSVYGINWDTNPNVIDPLAITEDEEK